MQTTKLRLSHLVNRGVICAWFPEDPLDGKLFHGSDVAFVVRYMYERRLRKSRIMIH